MKVLIATIGSYGDLNPYLALGKALAKRGHSAAIASSRHYRDDIERQGLAFFPLRPDTDLNKEDFKRIMDARNGSEYVVREFVMPHIRQSYEDLEAAAQGADLLISHALTYAAPVLAEKLKLPWISTVLSPMLFFSAHDPPVLAPAPWLSALRPLGPGFNGPLLKFLRKFSRSWGRPVQELRRELGLPQGADPIFEGQHSPYGVLCLFSEALAQARPDWPPKANICGFLFHDEDFRGLTFDPKLLDFLSAGSEPVCFTLGSSAVRAAGDFYEEAARACGITGRRAVLVAGEAAGSLSSSLPKDAIAVRSVSYASLFPRCAAIVHQGGIGTTAQAMRSGRPEVVVPFAHDQYDNAARVARLGLGRVLKRSSLDPKNLARALASVLAPPFTSRAEEIGRTVRSEDGEAAACSAIEQVLYNEKND